MMYAGTKTASMSLSQNVNDFAYSWTVVDTVDLARNYHVVHKHNKQDLDSSSCDPKAASQTSRIATRLIHR